MEVDTLIQKIRNTIIYARGYDNPLSQIREFNKISDILDNYELEQRIKNGEERMFVARFPKLNYMIVLPESLYKDKPHEWTVKTPFEVEIQVDKSMFKIEKDIDINRCNEIIKRKNEGKDISYDDAKYLENIMVIRNERTVR